jgi:hypothetical protein
MPLRRYHTPSLVRQTSSASIFPPLVRIITGLPPVRVPIPGPEVETGSLVALVCAVAVLLGDVFGEGADDGEGDSSGVAVGVETGGAGEASDSTLLMLVAAEALGDRCVAA